MWFRTRPADLAFADAAKHRFTYDFVVQGDPVDVFKAITDPAEMAHWFPDHREVRWLQGREAPGEGSLRLVKLKGLAVKERILVWREGERFAFHVTEISVPLLSKMVEDFRLNPTNKGGTRVQWTIAYRPKMVVRPLHPVLRPVFSKMFRQGTQRLAAHFDSADHAS